MSTKNKQKFKLLGSYFVIMGQWVTGSDPWPTWPIQKWWPIWPITHWLISISDVEPFDGIHGRSFLWQVQAQLLTS